MFQDLRKNGVCAILRKARHVEMYNFSIVKLTYEIRLISFDPKGNLLSHFSWQEVSIHPQTQFIFLAGTGGGRVGGEGCNKILWSQPHVWNKWVAFYKWMFPSICKLPGGRDEVLTRSQGLEMKRKSRQSSEEPNELPAAHLLHCLRNIWESEQVLMKAWLITHPCSY